MWLRNQHNRMHPMEDMHVQWRWDSFVLQEVVLSYILWTVERMAESFKSVIDLSGKYYTDMSQMGVNYYTSKILRWQTKYITRSWPSAMMMWRNLNLNTVHTAAWGITSFIITVNISINILVYDLNFSYRLALNMTFLK